MKTRALIAALNKADPSGELECCVGNCDIHFVDTEPSYYEGSLQVLNRDTEGSIVSGEFRSSGVKVTLFIHGVFDALYDDPEMPVTYDQEHSKRNYEHKVEETRAKVRAIEAKHAP